MTRLFPDGTERLGVSVSGGSDSTALMHLAAGWARPLGVALHVVSIDHGLRAEARSEIAQVAEQAAQLGLPHSALTWGGWSGHGNLQDAARRARRGLLEHWRGGIEDILIGHTMDDQAETFWLNLCRGSGVSGLSGMGECAGLRGVEPVEPVAVAGRFPSGARGRAATLWRPLLGERRAALRHWLRGQDLRWSDDPSNADPGFDRVQIRQALEQGSLMGVTVERLAATASRMQRARVALGQRAVEIAEQIAHVRHGDVVFDMSALAEIDAESRATIVAHALQWVASADYRPRSMALDKAISAVLSGRTATLHGCMMRVRAGEIVVTREARAVSTLEVPFDGDCLWDRRWRIRGEAREGASVRVLGTAQFAWSGVGLETDLPNAALATRPALWVGDTLLAVPGLDGQNWRADIRPPRGAFHASLLRA